MIINDLLPSGGGVISPREISKEIKESLEKNLAEEEPIHPKDVFESMEIPAEGMLEFYEKDHRFLGRRDLSEREMIYDHLRKTREIVDVEVDKNAGRVYIYWKAKPKEETEVENRIQGHGSIHFE